VRPIGNDDEDAL